MDPISITASSIAILGVITGTGKGIRKLISLRDAPLELQALYNEAEAFRSLLVIVQSSLRHAQGSEAYQEYEDALCNLLTEAKEAVLELESTIEYQLRRGVEVDQDGRPKVSRMTWMRSAGKIDDLREKIRNSRGNLSSGLQAINVHISEITRKTTIQLQSISTIEPHTSITHKVTDAAAERCPRDSEETIDHSDRDSTVNDANQIQTGRSLESPLQLVRHTTNAEESLIRVTTSVTTQHCAKLCPCQCHTRSSVPSPTWLKATLGQMLLTYHGLLRTTPCNYPPCRKTPRKTEFTYIFPRWLAQRALMVSSQSNLAGRGASISIAMPIIIESDHYIWHAVKCGNIPFLQQLFDRGFSPYIIDEFGNSLVLEAVVHYQAATSKFLIQQGAKADWRDSKNICATGIALLQDREYSLRNYEWDPLDIAEDMNFSSLHIAVTMQSPTAKDFKTLLESDFRFVNAVDRSKMSPLHWAARNGESVAVELLIEWKAHVDAKDSLNMTPLHHACVCGNLKCIIALLDAGADVNAETSDKATPLFFIRHADKGLVSLLVQRGGSIKHRANNGWTVLHEAAYRGRHQVIKEYMVHGAEVNAIDGFKETPIQQAIRSDQAETVLALLQTSGSEGNSIDLAIGPEGYNILHLMAWFGGTEIMRLLSHEILSGVDSTTKCEGMTPNDFFVRERDSQGILREPFDVEERAWHELLQSACRQNGIDFSSLGIVPSSRIEELTPDDDARCEGGSEDGGEDGVERFVDALEELIV